MKNKISAKVVADSLNSMSGDRITTMEVVFPRFILAEFNTHRMFSRNSASSRAIPFRKMLKSVIENLFIPIAFQKDHPGMQGFSYFEGWRAKVIEMAWIAGSKLAISAASKLFRLGLTKQLANRLLEPFMYHKVLVTFTASKNFFKLRCPQYEFESMPGKKFYSKKEVRKENHFANSLSDLDWFKSNKGMGEIHIMDLAEKMWDALNESTPRELKEGEWHIPYGDSLASNGEFYEFFLKNAEKEGKQWVSSEMHDQALDDTMAKIAIARCARLSYQTLGEDPKIDYEADIKLYEILKASGHFSPFEHVARAMTEDEYKDFSITKPSKEFSLSVDTSHGWCLNFKGFIQYRYFLE